LVEVMVEGGGDCGTTEDDTAVSETVVLFSLQIQPVLRQKMILLCLRQWCFFLLKFNPS
jgi:hypothetical protein